MNYLIVSLHVEHSRFRHSCSVLLKGLVQDAELEDLLDNATEEDWKRALNRGLETKLRNELGYKYHAYTGTMARIQESLKKLEEVVGMKHKKRWYDHTEYRRAKTWKKMKSCLAHSKHQQLLADIKDFNTQLEQLTPGIAPTEQAAAPQINKVDISHWDSIRRAAMSLHCALCSGWLCQCINAHATHFQLEDRTAAAIDSHQFKLAFMLPTAEDDGTLVESVSWQQVEFRALEEGGDSSALLPRSPGRVEFVPMATTGAYSQTKQITDLCKELQQSSGCSDAECIGFIAEEEHKHYIHLPKRPLAKYSSRNAITLRHLLLNKGKLASPFPLSIELLDRYELALLLASSLLQLHTTSWLGEQWSTEDIHFVPTESDVALRDCTFVMQSFPSTTLVATTDKTPRESARQLVIRNEAIFRLGATLVELSTAATLDSQETEDDRDIVELADFKTADRLSEKMTRNNVREWNAVVGKCLRCGFHCPPDFSRKDFRKEFYQWVVVPLQRLYDDAKPD
ncbi:hypothetical protein ACHAPT_006439 [Fusarium lateritium]